MKKFTQIALCASALSTAFGISAQNWENHPSKLVDAYENLSVAADFTGNNRLDIYHTGAYSTEWCRPFNFRIDNGCEVISSLLRSNADGTFTADWNAPYNYEDDSREDYVAGQANNTRMILPGHGITPAGRGDAIALDFNNDGLVDLITFSRQDHSGWWYFWGSDMCDAEGNPVTEGIPERRNERLTLYKNLGDGRFQMVANTGLIEMSKPDGDVVRAISAGDYDNDGFIDLLVSGVYVDAAKESYVDEQNHYNRFVRLYRNLGNVAEGEAQFEEKLIANTFGGVYTEQKNDEEGNIVAPKEELKGHFAPISGNAQFADFNNDGWLDVIISGYGEIFDGNYQGGPLMRLYVNNEGKSFEDVTNQDEKTVGLNNTTLVVNDFNHDGYLDYFTAGYSWYLGDSKALIYLNQKDEAIFGSYIDNNDSHLPNIEGTRWFATDFDNDGNLDLYSASRMGDSNAIFFGTESGREFESDNTDMQGWTNDDAHCGTIGDFTGNGVADIYVPHERAWDGENNTSFENPNPAVIKVNKMELINEVSNPAAPTDVKFDQADGKLNISWNYDVDAAIAANLAYNIYVKFADGSIATLVPADPETGFVKVAEGKQVALRPTLTNHTIATSNAVEKVGVQAISLNNFTASEFTLASDATGIKAIESARPEGPVTYYNLQGVKVANPEKGQVVIRLQGNQATKVVF